MIENGVSKILSVSEVIVVVGSLWWCAIGTSLQLLFVLSQVWDSIMTYCVDKGRSERASKFYYKLGSRRDQLSPQVWAIYVTLNGMCIVCVCVACVRCVCVCVCVCVWGMCEVCVCACVCVCVCVWHV